MSRPWGKTPSSWNTNEQYLNVFWKIEGKNKALSPALKSPWCVFHLDYTELCTAETEVGKDVPGHHINLSPLCGIFLHSLPFILLLSFLLFFLFSSFFSSYRPAFFCSPEYLISLLCQDSSKRAIKRLFQWKKDFYLELVSVAYSMFSSHLLFLVTTLWVTAGNLFSFPVLKPLRISP